MTNRFEIYKCNVCDNVAEICIEGAGKLVCCGEEMELMRENMANNENAHFAILEKISDVEKKITFNHEMTQEHFIEFVEVISKDKRFMKRKYFNFDDELELTFKCECKNGFDVRLLCNRDGVWKTVIE